MILRHFLFRKQKVGVSEMKMNDCEMAKRRSTITRSYTEIRITRYVYYLFTYLHPRIILPFFFTSRFDHDDDCGAPSSPQATFASTISLPHIIKLVVFNYNLQHFRIVAISTSVANTLRRYVT